jgi:dCMP deaminase
LKDKFIKYFATIAEETAKLSNAKKLQVGCVIVKDNRILSIGYNGTPSGWSNECEFVIDTGTNIYYETKPEVLHAERNALDKIAKSTESSEGADLFVTHTPCIECAKSIYNTGIKQVYYINEYDGTVGSGIKFLEKAGIEICQVS